MVGSLTELGKKRKWKKGTQTLRETGGNWKQETKTVCDGGEFGTAKGCTYGHRASLLVCVWPILHAEITNNSFFEQLFRVTCIFV